MKNSTRCVHQNAEGYYLSDNNGNYSRTWSFQVVIDKLERIYANMFLNTRWGMTYEESKPAYHTMGVAINAVIADRDKERVDWL